MRLSVILFINRHKNVSHNYSLIRSDSKSKFVHRPKLYINIIKWIDISYTSIRSKPSLPTRHARSGMI